MRNVGGVSRRDCGIEESSRGACVNRPIGSIAIATHHLPFLIARSTRSIRSSRCVPENVFFQGALAAASVTAIAARRYYGQIYVASYG